MWYTGSLSAFVAAFFKLFKHHVYTFTWQVQWKLVRLKPFSGGDLSHLQLLLVRGDTLFTLHFPMYQMACTSGTAEAPSPDITWATRCLRYVSTWLLLNYSKKIVLEETKYILFWVFFFLFYNPAGSECSASSCIWSKISQVCTGTSTILKEFKNKCTFNEPINLI